MCKTASEAQSTFALPLTSAFYPSGLPIYFPPASSLYGSCAGWVEASRSVVPLLTKVKHDWEVCAVSLGYNFLFQHERPAEEAQLTLRTCPCNLTALLTAFVGAFLRVPGARAAPQPGPRGAPQHHSASWRETESVGWEREYP